MNETGTAYEIYKARVQVLSKLKIRVAKLLADEKCTVDEAEFVLNEAKRFIREQSIVQVEP